MTSKAMISEIETAIDGNPSDWTIGITDDPANRKAQLGNPLNWLQWQARSTDVASDVMQHFLSKSFKNGGRKPRPGMYVFIFED